MHSNAQADPSDTRTCDETKNYGKANKEPPRGKGKKRLQTYGCLPINPNALKGQRLARPWGTSLKIFCIGLSGQEIPRPVKNLGICSPNKEDGEKVGLFFEACC